MDDDKKLLDSDMKQMDDNKKRLEAVLFASGKRMTLDELARLIKVRNRDSVKEAIKELMADYEKKEGSLYIDKVEEDGEVFWKLTVRSQMIPIINRIVTKTELPKSIIETLAYIAYKYPVKQSELIKIRSNKAYDHLKELEKTGYISRQKYGRTNLIKLTDKFFDYFELPPDKLKEKFRDFEQLEKAIEAKEAEAKIILDGHKKKQKDAKQKALEAKKEDEALEPDLDQLEIELSDSKGGKVNLKVYDMMPGDVPSVYAEPPKITEVTNKLGELDVIETGIPELGEQMQKQEHKEPDHLGDMEVYDDSGNAGMGHKSTGSGSGRRSRTPDEIADSILNGINSDDDSDVANNTDNNIDDDNDSSDSDNDSGYVEEDYAPRRSSSVDDESFEDDSDDDADSDDSIQTGDKVSENKVSEESSEQDESDIEDSIIRQRESLEPHEIDGADGFEKPVEEYLDRMSDIRAEELLTGRKVQAKGSIGDASDGTNNNPDGSDLGDDSSDDSPLIDMPKSHVTDKRGGASDVSDDGSEGDVFDDDKEIQDEFGGTMKSSISRKDRSHDMSNDSRKGKKSSALGDKASDEDEILKAQQSIKVDENEEVDLPDMDEFDSDAKQK